MAGTIKDVLTKLFPNQSVSMKSGLDGRNNPGHADVQSGVSGVSMKSGLDGRNNENSSKQSTHGEHGLNEVRPRWPEQCFE